MSDDPAQEREQQQQQLEADLVAARIRELHESPILGNFDIAHLKAVHAHIFQDFPEHRPGVIRANTKRWVINRTLEGERSIYYVPYVDTNIGKCVDKILTNFGGRAPLKGLTLDAAASRIAALYGDLDHVHGFYEGNSRTLREFTRELALAAGFTLDWIGTGIGAKERNDLYRARDIAVIDRPYPNLTSERAMTTNDGAEYEISFVLDRLRQALDGKSLATVIRAALTVTPAHPPPV